MTLKNDNVGKCGHAKCAGGAGVLCYEKGKPMREYAREEAYKGQTIEIHRNGMYSVFASEYGYLKADTIEGARAWIDAICEHCGIMHDVDDETRATGSGHDYVQAARINECDKVKYPNEESLQRKLPTKDEQVAAGEYCGICGSTAETLEDYEAREKRAWLCSDECDRERINQKQ